MRGLGVNRISFGAQSFNDAKLKFLGRAHSAAQIFLAVQNAKAAGFDNINLDLIYASKFDDKRNLKFEMDELARCEVPHLSAYALSLEENTQSLANSCKFTSPFRISNIYPPSRAAGRDLR